MRVMTQIFTIQVTTISLRANNQPVWNKTAILQKKTFPCVCNATLYVKPEHLNIHANSQQSHICAVVSLVSCKKKSFQFLPKTGHC